MSVVDLGCYVVVLLFFFVFVLFLFVCCFFFLFVLFFLMFRCMILMFILCLQCRLDWDGVLLWGGAAVTRLWRLCVVAQL